MGGSPPADSYCYGRYASYTNAFLFDQIIPENCMKIKEIESSRGWGIPSAQFGSINGMSFDFPVKNKIGSLSIFVTLKIVNMLDIVISYFHFILKHHGHVNFALN